MDSPHKRILSGKADIGKVIQTFDIRWRVKPLNRLSPIGHAIARRLL
jgi:hypothetical protein